MLPPLRRCPELNACAVQHIAEHLGPLKTLIIRRVCRLWYYSLSSDVVWGKKLLRDYPQEKFKKGRAIQKYTQLFLLSKRMDTFTPICEYKSKSIYMALSAALLNPAEHFYAQSTSFNVIRNASKIYVYPANIKIPSYAFNTALKCNLKGCIYDNTFLIIEEECSKKIEVWNLYTQQCLHKRDNIVLKNTIREGDYYSSFSEQTLQFIPLYTNEEKENLVLTYIDAPLLFHDLNHTHRFFICKNNTFFVTSLEGTLEMKIKLDIHLEDQPKDHICFYETFFHYIIGPSFVSSAEGDFFYVINKITQDVKKILCDELCLLKFYRNKVYFLRNQTLYDYDPDRKIEQQYRFCNTLLSIKGLTDTGNLLLFGMVHANTLMYIIFNLSKLNPHTSFLMPDETLSCRTLNLDPRKCNFRMERGLLYIYECANPHTENTLYIINSVTGNVVKRLLVMGLFLGLSPEYILMFYRLKVGLLRNSINYVNIDLDIPRYVEELPEEDEELFK